VVAFAVRETPMPAGSPRELSPSVEGPAPRIGGIRRSPSAWGACAVCTEGLVSESLSNANNARDAELDEKRFQRQAFRHNRRG
jgi:hypothetical protein